MPQGFVIRLTMMNANVGTSQLWHQLRVPDSPARCMRQVVRLTMLSAARQVEGFELASQL